MGMGNQNKNSDDDECGTIPTERGRSDVLPKLKDNIHKHMEGRLSVAQKHVILFQDANKGRLLHRELTDEPWQCEEREHVRQEVH